MDDAAPLRVVATLTTRAPPYHAGLLENLQSLAAGFDDVLLGLPKRSRDGTPYTTVEGLPSGVRTVWLDEDLGPATKILAAVREAHGADLVVTVDDDMLYNSSEMRATFERYYGRDAREGVRRVYAFAGAYIGRFRPDVPTLLSVDGGWDDWRWTLDGRELKSLTTIAGYAGVAYPASVLLEYDPEEYIRACLSKDVNGELLKNDDIVLSAYLASHAIERCMLPRIRVGRHNKPETEPRLSPSIWEIVRVARHPAVGPVFAMNNSDRPVPLLGDAVVGMCLLIVYLVVAWVLFLLFPG